ncbi:HAD family hydrolase [Acinetobacter baumannii]|nr:HAD family hydrolase [Acinetobacter baumannii]
MTYNYYFDLDGTLIESNVDESSVAEVFNLLDSNTLYSDFVDYCDFIFKSSPFFDYMFSVGIGVNELFWIDKYFYGDELEEFYKWVDVFQRVCYKYIKGLYFCEKPFPMSTYFRPIAIKKLIVNPEFLDVYFKKLNSNFYIITNGDSYIQYQKIFYSGLLPFFKMVFVSGDFGVGKPSKCLYRKILNITRENPEECYMIGDSIKKDILPSGELGFRTLHIKSQKDLLAIN